MLGQVSCPGNPPPPAGSAPWTGDVPPAIEMWASSILHDPEHYPMFAEAYAVINGVAVVAQVQHHTLQGATGRTGCFRGVSIFRSTSAPITYVAPHPSGPVAVHYMAPTPAAPTHTHSLLELISFAILGFSTGFGVTWAICKDGCGPGLPQGVRE